MSDSLLDAVKVVLYEPQDPVNIAATIRAMKNMGVGSLRLVRPVETDPYRLEGIAHDTAEIIAAIERFDTLDAALADCVKVAGFTARRRAAKRVIVAPREAASQLLEAGREGPVALLFGREDSGLPNDALDHAHIVITVPTTGHASLNLAQAVLLGLYELHLAAADATRVLKPARKDAPAAVQEEFERFFEDAERALEAIQFFKTRQRENIMRSLRTLTYQAAPDARQITLARAMAIEVVRYLGRYGLGPSPRRGATARALVEDDSGDDAPPAA